MPPKHQNYVKWTPEKLINWDSKRCAYNKNQVKLKLYLYYKFKNKN